MPPTFTKITPSLPVRSIPDSIKYYTEVLGFRISGRDRDDHTWLSLGGEEEERAEKGKDAIPVNVYLRSMCVCVWVHLLSVFIFGFLLFCFKRVYRGAEESFVIV